MKYLLQVLLLAVTRGMTMTAVQTPNVGFGEVAEAGINLDRRVVIHLGRENVIHRLKAVAITGCGMRVMDWTLPYGYVRLEDYFGPYRLCQRCWP